jgi:hypothetical protein
MPRETMALTEQTWTPKATRDNPSWPLGWTQLRRALLPSRWWPWQGSDHLLSAITALSLRLRFQLRQVRRVRRWLLRWL